MFLKLLFFIGLIALTTIEAKHFLKQLQLNGKHLMSYNSNSERAFDSVRKRRDAEDTSSSSSESVEDLLKFLVAAAWEGNKQEILGDLIEEMSDTDNNVTVIGWQRVVDEQGDVKEIRSVQLVIPPKPNIDRPDNIVQDDDDDNDDDRMLPHKEINEMKEIFEPFYAIGTPASMTKEQWNEDGKLKNFFYMDKDELYGNFEGFSIYNKTSFASIKEVDDFVAKLPEGALGKPSVLRYDTDGNLLLDQSNIKPQLLGTVMEHHGASDKMLREAPEIIARVAYTYPQDEIARHLCIEYNKLYPEYKWRVLVDPDHYSITRDIELTLTYDNMDFDENSNIVFVVYGLKKTTK